MGRRLNDRCAAVDSRTRIARGFACLTAAVLLMGMTPGCAQSIRMTHQSNAYFELCHGADYDAMRTPSEREACWSAWLQHYREGQSPDRIRYAETRRAQAATGGPLEPLPGLQPAAANAAQTPAYLSRTLPFEGDGPADDDAPVPPARRSPPAGDGPCATVCGPRWSTCEEECAGRDGPACHQACETEHRTCMRGCY